MKPNQGNQLLNDVIPFLFLLWPNSFCTFAILHMFNCGLDPFVALFSCWLDLSLLLLTKTTLKHINTFNNEYLKDYDGNRVLIKNTILILFISKCPRFFILEHLI